MIQESKRGEAGAVVFILVFVVLAGNLLLAGLASARVEPPAIVIVAVIAFVASELSLLAIYLGLGGLPLPVRLLLTVPGGLIIFFPFYVQGMHRQGDWRELAVCNLIALPAAIPLVIMRMAGWRLVRFDWPGEAENWRPEGRPLQFTLRQMFTWTLAVAMVCGWLRLLPKDFWREPVAILVAAALCALLGVAAYATVWAALGKTLPEVRLLIVSVVAGFIALIPCVLSQAPFEAAICFWFGAALEVWLLGGALCLMRMVGWRLVRSRNSATAERPIMAEMFEPASGPLDP